MTQAKWRYIAVDEDSVAWGTNDSSVAKDAAGHGTYVVFDVREGKEVLPSFVSSEARGIEELVLEEDPDDEDEEEDEE